MEPIQPKDYSLTRNGCECSITGKTQQMVLRRLWRLGYRGSLKVHFYQGWTGLHRIYAIDALLWLPPVKGETCSSALDIRLGQRGGCYGRYNVAGKVKVVSDRCRLMDELTTHIKRGQHHASD